MYFVNNIIYLKNNIFVKKIISSYIMIGWNFLLWSVYKSSCFKLFLFVLPLFMVWLLKFYK